QKKNIALAAWHAPFGGCPEKADLCRGQGFRRVAPSASPRSENRHVQGPAGSEGQEGILRKSEPRYARFERPAHIWTPDRRRAAHALRSIRGMLKIKSKARA